MTRRIIATLALTLLLAAGCEDDTAGDCPNPDHPARFTLTDGDRIAQWGAIDQDGDGVICLTRAEYPIATGGTEWADPTPAPVYPQVTP